MPAFIGLPSRSFAPDRTSTFTQLLFIPSIVSALPSSRIFTFVPACITVRTWEEVAFHERSFRFSFTVIVLFRAMLVEAVEFKVLVATVVLSAS